MEFPYITGESFYHMLEVIDAEILLDFGLGLISDL
jgi:hypothetical protein